MNVLYWNVCNTAGNQEIIAQTEALMREHDIDVACLQEVPYDTRIVNGKALHVPVSNAIAADLGYQAMFEEDAMFAHTRTLKNSPTKLKGYGTAIISRADIVDFANQTLRDDRFTYMTPGAGNKRSLLTARTADNPDIAISVAHKSYPLPLGIGSKGLRQEDDELIIALAKLKDKGEVMFGGDLNRKPEAPIDQKLVQLKLDQVVDPKQPTFRSRHIYAGYTKRNLDRVYVSQGIRAQAVIGDRRQSDHHPIIVSVTKK